MWKQVKERLVRGERNGSIRRDQASDKVKAYCKSSLFGVRVGTAWSKEMSEMCGRLSSSEDRPTCMATFEQEYGSSVGGTKTCPETEDIMVEAALFNIHAVRKRRGGGEGDSAQREFLTGVTCAESVGSLTLG